MGCTFGNEKFNPNKHETPGFQSKLEFTGYRGPSTNGFTP